MEKDNNLLCLLFIGSLYALSLEDEPMALVYLDDALTIQATQPGPSFLHPLQGCTVSQWLAVLYVIIFPVDGHFRFQILLSRNISSTLPLTISFSSEATLS